MSMDTSYYYENLLHEWFKWGNFTAKQYAVFYNPYMYSQ